MQGIKYWLCPEKPYGKMEKMALGPFFPYVFEILSILTEKIFFREIKLAMCTVVFLLENFFVATNNKILSFCCNKTNKTTKTNNTIISGRKWVNQATLITVKVSVNAKCLAFAEQLKKELNNQILKYFLSEVNNVRSISSAEAKNSKSLYPKYLIQ